MGVMPRTLTFMSSPVGLARLMMVTISSDASGWPDEFFTMPGFLEVESLGPLVRLDPNAQTEHVERWRVIPNIELPDEEGPLIAALNPHLAAFGLEKIES